MRPNLAWATVSGLSLRSVYPWIPGLMTRKILVAVPDAGLRELLSDALVAMDCEVVGAESGRQALALLVTEAIDSDPFTGLLLDLKIADLDALTTLEEIRDRHERLPFIILAEERDQARITRALELGAAAILHKPPDLERLRQTCSRVFFGGRTK
jgi:DNA-binding NtrC family response regulator